MKQLILFFLLCIGFSLAGQAQTDKRLKKVDKELNEVLETWQAAGFAVAVVEKDTIIYRKGLGYRDYENKIPVTPNTQFAIGSCSKAFTSGLLGKLEAQDKLSLSDHPARHIPELEFYNDELNTGLTLRDMMCHRSGLPRHDLAWYLFPTNNKDELVKRIAYQEPFADLRETWYYNNFMFLTQGVVAERVTGKSWEQNIEEQFFKPLGMNSSTTEISGLADADDRAIGYEVKDESIRKMDYYDIAAMGAAGSINSSVNEMANWLKVWINGGKYNDQEILPAGYVQQAMSSQMVVNAGMPEKGMEGLHLANYGFGWFISSYKGHYMVQHGGNIDGFSANTCFFPSDSIGIVVLANQNGSAVPSVVRNIIADRLLEVNETDWNTVIREKYEKAMKAQKEGKTAQADKRVTGTEPAHELTAFAGNYHHPGYGTFEVMVNNDSLFIQFPKKKFWLKHYHYNVFTMLEKKEGAYEPFAEEGSYDLRMNFITSADGEVETVRAKLEPMLDPLEFSRQAPEVALALEELNRYVGEYELAGTTSKVYLKDNDKLFLFVPGQPEYELVANGENKFSIKNLDGYNLEFNENGAGEVSEVLFIQPNGTFKAKKKE